MATNKRVFVLVLLCALSAAARADTTWNLQQSTLAYHISHPLHSAEGVSHAARGKGVCHAGICDFLVGVPVKSFDSGDSNRDLHMLQVTRGAEYPMVTVRTRIPEASLSLQRLLVDVEVSFAGQTAEYKQLPFEATVTGDQAHITGTIPATLTQFKINPPTLLGMPIKNDIPVQVDMTWRKD